ncbi:MAG: NUMOD3 domain-containing DNA-binding protein [Pseudomonadota bacterium]
MDTYQPYFYIIGWKQLDWCYAGIEYANGRKVAHPSNLFRKDSSGTRYETSSKRVAKLVRFFGDPEILEIIPCDDADQAMELEYQYLKAVDPLTNPRWLNANVGRSIVLDEFTRAAISAGQMGRVVSEETRQKQSAKRKGKTPWNKGIVSPRRGIPQTEQHRAAIKAAKAENPQICTYETKLKLRASKGSISRELALEVLNAAGTPKEIAERFGIRRGIVYSIKSGRHWICSET